MSRRVVDPHALCRAFRLEQSEQKEAMQQSGWAHPSCRTAAAAAGSVLLLPPVASLSVPSRRMPLCHMLPALAAAWGPLRREDSELPWGAPRQQPVSRILPQPAGGTLGTAPSTDLCCSCTVSEPLAAPDQGSSTVSNRSCQRFVLTVNRGCTCMRCAPRATVSPDAKEL